MGMSPGMGGGNMQGQNQMQGGGPGPMRQNRQNDRQNRNALTTRISKTTVAVEISKGAIMIMVRWATTWE